MYFFHPRGEVLDEEFAEVVQSLQLFGLREQEEGDKSLGFNKDNE